MRIHRIVISLVIVSTAYGFEVENPKIVASVPEDKHVFETDIAVGADTAISVYILGGEPSPTTAGRRIGYSFYDPANNAWIQSIIQADPSWTSVYDPSVAYNDLSDTFLAVGIREEAAVGIPVFSAFSEGRMLPWSELDWPHPVVADKPWIVSGRIPGEFYCQVWSANGAVELYRTKDTGQTWTSSTIAVNGVPISVGLPSTRLVVASDGSLYIAVMESHPTIRVLKGEVQSDDTILFDYLLDANSQAIEVTLEAPEPCISEFLPGTFLPAIVETQLEVDPLDSERLYLAFPDTAPQGSVAGGVQVSDVNIYSVVVRKESNSWVAEPRVAIHATAAGTDRFMPMMTIDRLGRIHISYFDDRAYSQADTDPNPKFDLYYSTSLDGGSTYQEQEVVSNALDFCATPDNFQPREYAGIEARDGFVWIAYPGHISEAGGNCVQANEVAIWAIRIDVADSNRRYVRFDLGNDLADGLTWLTPLKTVQEALQRASDPANGIEEIWVDKFTYPLDQSVDGRFATHELSGGIALYGGFDFSLNATSSFPYWDRRASTNYMTTLSGITVGCTTDTDCSSVGAGTCNIGLCTGSLDASAAPYNIVSVYNAGIEAILDGFVVTGGYADGLVDDVGGGIRISDSVVRISNCKLANNFAESGGGGLYTANSLASLVNLEFDGNTSAIRGGAAYALGDGETALVSCTIKNSSGLIGGGLHSDCGILKLSNCELHDNTATASGGAIYASGSPLQGFIDRCRIRDNDADFGGGIFLGNADTFVITNSLFEQNSTDFDGGAMKVGSESLTITNCTFLNNDAARSTGGIFLNGISSATINNCVFWGNTDTTGFPTTSQLFPSIDFCVAYSCIQHGVSGVGNISIDPMVDIGGGLSTASPCIDAADGTVDVDIITPGVQALPGVDLNGKIRKADNFEAPNSGVGTPPVDMGALELTDPRVYVDANSTCGQSCDGDSWATAFSDLQEGLLHASNTGRKVIWITGSPGRNYYYPDEPNGLRTASFVVPTGVAIYGGFSGNESLLSERDWVTNLTILSGDLNGDDDELIPGFENDGDNVFHVVSVDNSDGVLLDGLIITAGNANGAGQNETHGGGLLITNGSALVRNCRFIASQANFGGGAALIHESNAAPRFENCEFNGNAVSAIYSEAILEGIVMINCTVTETTGIGLMGPGPLEPFQALYRVVNTTVTGITGEGISSVIGTQDVSFSNIEGSVYPGAENVNFDPSFANAAGPDGTPGTIDDDLRLRFESALLNRGTSSVLGEGVTIDLMGNNRFQGVAVDIGAFEFPVREPVAPLPEPAQGMIVANRYLSIKSGQTTAAMKVTVLESGLFPSMSGDTWWVQEHDANDPPDVYRLGCSQFYVDWSLAPDTIFVTGDAVVPDTKYEIEALIDQGVASVAPIGANTVAKPNHHWGDIVGDWTGSYWSSPNGTVNFVDVNAVVATFQASSLATTLNRADLAPSNCDAVVNFGDVQAVVLGFQNQFFPYSQPNPCP